MPLTWLRCTLTLGYISSRNINGITRVLRQTSTEGLEFSSLFENIGKQHGVGVDTATVSPNEHECMGDPTAKLNKLNVFPLQEDAMYGVHVTLEEQMWVPEPEDEGRSVVRMQAASLECRRYVCLCVCVRAPI